MAFWKFGKDSSSSAVEYASFTEASSAALQKLDLKPVEIYRPNNKAGGQWAKFRMLEKIGKSHRSSIMSSISSDMKLDRAVGCMVGMAVCDALGAPLEFLPVCNGDGEKDPFSCFDLNTMEYKGTSNKFRLKPGQWTDDASMGFCIADSYLANNGKYHGSDIRTRFHLWWNFGYCNAFVNDASRSGSVGLGGNIAMSLDSCKAGEVPTPTFERDNEDAGVGSLMRLAAVPVRHHGDIESARVESAMSSQTTHPGLLAAECCAFVAHLIVLAINRPSDGTQEVSLFIDGVVSEYIGLLERRLLEIESDTSASESESTSQSSAGNAITQMLRLLKCEEADESTERCWNWRSRSLEIDLTVKNRGHNYNGYPVMRGYFGSFCMDGLSMALWSVYHTQSFDLAAERCVNLLGDADSTAAIAGQIAGAFYGYSSISPEMIKQLEQWDDGDAALRGALLYSMGCTTNNNNPEKGKGEAEASCTGP